MSHRIVKFCMLRSYACHGVVRGSNTEASTKALLSVLVEVTKGLGAFTKGMLSELARKNELGTVERTFSMRWYWEGGVCCSEKENKRQ